MPRSAARFSEVARPIYQPSQILLFAPGWDITALQRSTNQISSNYVVGSLFTSSHGAVTHWDTSWPDSFKQIIYLFRFIERLACWRSKLFKFDFDLLRRNSDKHLVAAALWRLEAISEDESHSKDSISRYTTDKVDGPHGLANAICNRDHHLHQTTEVAKSKHWGIYEPLTTVRIVCA